MSSSDSIQIHLNLELNQDQAAKYTRDKKTWYLALLANKYWIPKLSSRACTLRFLSQIRPEDG